MTIVNKIIASIHAALDTQREVEDENGNTVTVPVPFPVYYHDDPTLNLMTSDMSFPCALVQLLTTGRMVMEAGQAKESVTVAVFFVQPTEFDFDAEDNEQLIEECKGHASRWLLSLNASDVERIGEVRTSRVYDRYDDILTGFGVTFDAKETIGDCIGN